MLGAASQCGPLPFPSHILPVFELKFSPQNIPLLATEGILGQMTPSLPVLQRRGRRVLEVWLRFPPQGPPERHRAPSLSYPERAEDFFIFLLYFNVFGNIHNCSHLKGPEGTPVTSPALLTELLVARELTNFCSDPLRSQIIFGWNCFHKVS